MSDADYEAKAREVMRAGGFKNPAYEGGPFEKRVAAALAQSAAEMRERCEKLVRAHGINGCERGMTDPSTGAFECRRADRGDCNCYEFDELADDIAALAGEMRERCEAKYAELVAALEAIRDDPDASLNIVLYAQAALKA